MVEERTPKVAIAADGLGVRFRRNRRGRRSFKDLFAGASRRSRPDEFWPLRNVSFVVEPGEAIGVVGRNGQGKSTLLRLVAKVLLPDEGTVTVNGGVAPLIEITGGFVGDLTVRENVRLTAGLHGMSRAEVSRRYDDIIAFAELAGFEDTPAPRFRRRLPARRADPARRRGARGGRQGVPRQVLPPYRRASGGRTDPVLRLAQRARSPPFLHPGAVPGPGRAGPRRADRYGARSLQRGYGSRVSAALRPSGR
ncbi:unnamed protein product [Penicillium discolor]